MNSVIGFCLMGAGVLFNVFGCIGLVRLPDIYNRLQAATKCVTLGSCLILAGAAVLSADAAMIMKCLICIIFILITSPTAAHALARGAYSSGVKLWEKSVIDQYQEDIESGTAKDQEK